MGLARAGCQHCYRRLVGMHHRQAQRVGLHRATNGCRHKPQTLTQAASDERGWSGRRARRGPTDLRAASRVLSSRRPQASGSKPSRLASSRCTSCTLSFRLPASVLMNTSPPPVAKRNVRRTGGTRTSMT